ncbi:hypothetical protein QFZ74_000319 [Streptomyces sp. V3I7]|nr:hypothetical protein [Streptomyces sp. V3I7]
MGNTAAEQHARAALKTVAQLYGAKRSPSSPSSAPELASNTAVASNNPRLTPSYS